MTGSSAVLRARYPRAAANLNRYGGGAARRLEQIGIFARFTRISVAQIWWALRHYRRETLRLTAEIAMRSATLPPVQRTRLGARGLEWFGASAPAVGEAGLIHIYINPALPQPLKIPCSVVGERSDGTERVAQLQFRDLSEGVVDLLEKLIFRHHRRLVAGARASSPSAH